MLKSKNEGVTDTVCGLQILKYYLKYLLQKNIYYRKSLLTAILGNHKTKVSL